MLNRALNRIMCVKSYSCSVRYYIGQIPSLIGDSGTTGWTFCIFMLCKTLYSADIKSYRGLLELVGPVVFVFNVYLLPTFTIVDFIISEKMI